jgi:hypothetical protein
VAASIRQNFMMTTDKILESLAPLYGVNHMQFIKEVIKALIYLQVTNNARCFCIPLQSLLTRDNRSPWHGLILSFSFSESMAQGTPPTT